MYSVFIWILCYFSYFLGFWPQIRDTKLTNTRFTTRMVPVQTVCHSSIETMTLTLQPILDTFFQSHKPKSFAVQCAIRAHASLDRMTVINAVVAMVTQANGAPLEVDLDEPELNVFVDITARVCCLSLLPDFQKYSRYSIHALLGLGTHATGPRTQNVVTAVPDAPDNGDAETEPEASEQ
jgi:tRNA acetyltransferase TAN1